MKQVGNKRRLLALLTAMYNCIGCYRSLVVSCNQTFMEVIRQTLKSVDHPTAVPEYRNDPEAVLQKIKDVRKTIEAAVELYWEESTDAKREEFAPEDILVDVNAVLESLNEMLPDDLLKVLFNIKGGITYEAITEMTMEEYHQAKGETLKRASERINSYFIILATAGQIFLEKNLESSTSSAKKYFPGMHKSLIEGREIIRRDDNYAIGQLTDSILVLKGLEDPLDNLYELAKKEQDEQDRRSEGSATPES